MAPTLKPGQNVITINWFIKPKKGDLVVVSKKGRLMIKRIKAINGLKIFLIGDNLLKSTDSRHFGEINLKDVQGKVVVKL